MPAWQRLLKAAVAFYVAAMVPLVVLWEIAPEVHPLVALSNIFAIYAFAPLVALLPLALLLRWRVLGTTLAALLLVALLLFVPALLPRPAQPLFAEHPDPILRVVTFNQLSFNQRVDDAVAALMAQDADIIVVQELSYAMEQRLVLREDAYPYQALDPLDRPGGLGILSRYPIADIEGLTGIRGMRATVGVEGQHITLMNVHPSTPMGLAEVCAPFIPICKRVPTYSPEPRNTQLEHLLQQIAATEGPLIVAGDFNMANRESIYRRFDAMLRDAHAEAGWGLGHTFPNAATSNVLARVRIDYIWSSADIAPHQAEVYCGDYGSDHCMLVADLNVFPLSRPHIGYNR
jgi:endonuclease/exonuclease/phosphatase (EEP) superfamily protein YafD